MIIGTLLTKPIKNDRDLPINVIVTKSATRSNLYAFLAEALGLIYQAVELQSRKSSGTVFALSKLRASEVSITLNR